MQKVLLKRVLRDLKANWVRYAALSALIILCMYLIVSMVGAADTIIIQTTEKAKENKVEDGEFTVFIPLKNSEIEQLEADGIILEEQFYLDFVLENNNTIRVFNNREKINLVDLSEGRLAQNVNEIVLEKRYCEENALEIDDTIKMADKEYKVVGIGTAPDYEAALNKMSDANVDSKQFGASWVCSKEYELLKDSIKSLKSEEYVYAYRLNGAMTNDELKEKIKDFDFSVDSVEDELFKEYWEENVGCKEDLEEGIDDLAEGSGELLDGLEELKSNNSKLNDGTKKLFDMYLEQANTGFKEYGLDNELTEDNFEEELTKLKNKLNSPIVSLKINSIIDDLKALKEYKDGIEEYTNGVREAADGCDELNDGMKELNDETDDIIDDLFDIDISNLTQFMIAEDNPRIGAAGNDQIVSKLAGLVAGVIVIILFTYVISVFVVHSIEKESSIIGALYSLGVKKQDLLLHYLMLPVIITFLSGIVGSALGFSKFGIETQMQDCYGYFSLPDVEKVISPYLLVYSILMPPVSAVIVNCLVIRKKLNQPALKLIKNEHKQNEISNIDLKNMGFIGRFRVRQMLRELRSSCAVVFGMFVSLLILMMSMDTYVLCENIKKNNVSDTKFEYMYTYKYPEKEVPEGGEAAYAKTLRKEVLGYTHDITVLGINEDNPYFDADVKEGKSIVSVSSAMAEKYSIEKGDKIILTDDEDGMDYAFTVDSITQYSTGFYAFMDIDSMRELFNESDDYYNVVFASEPLDIDSKRLYAETTKNNIEKSAKVFSNMMVSMIVMLSSVSSLIFVVVMYLMMKVMIDRSAFNISLIKIFGYRKNEIKKLYLDGNFYVIAIGALICIPTSKTVMDALYPMLIANVACGMDLKFSPGMYLGIYVAIIILYFIINYFLVRRLNKLVPAEVLKNRE